MVNGKRLLSTTELAKILGLSRITVYKRVKKGEIQATRVGHGFVIDRKTLGGILDENISREEKLAVEKSVKKTVREYGETLRLLGAS